MSQRLDRQLSPGYEDYSAERKAEVIALCRASTITEVSRGTGIPRQTLYNWLAQSDRYDHLLTRKEGDLASKLENIAHLSADLVEERLPSATIRELLGAIHITVPALQLLRGQPTSITESTHTERTELMVTLSQALDETQVNLPADPESLRNTPETQ